MWGTLSLPLPALSLADDTHHGPSSGPSCYHDYPFILYRGFRVSATGQGPKWTIHGQRFQKKPTHCPFRCSTGPRHDVGARREDNLLNLCNLLMPTGVGPHLSNLPPPQGKLTNLTNLTKPPGVGPLLV